MDETFEIKTPQVDIHQVMSQIQERIEEKRRAGVYDRYNLTLATALELENFKSDESYLDYYLRTIERDSDIDIGDFKISSKVFFMGQAVVWLKKIIWKLLKFYTFRLFSQQKEFNAKTASIVQVMNRKFERRLARLEENIEEINEKIG